MYLRSLFIMVVTAISLQAHAYGTAQQLVTDCTATPIRPEEGLRQINCTGYISGVLDAYGVLSSLFPSVRLYCASSAGLSVDSAIDAVVNWLRASPDRSRTPARSAIFLALRERYPC